MSPLACLLGRPGARDVPLVSVAVHTASRLATMERAASADRAPFKTQAPLLDRFERGSKGVAA